MMSSSKPTFEVTVSDGEIKGTLKIGNETISVYLKEIAEEDCFSIMVSPFIRRTITKRKFILIEE